MEDKLKKGFMWFFFGCFLVALYQHELTFAGLLAVSIGSILASDARFKTLVIPLLVMCAGMVFVGVHTFKSFESEDKASDVVGDKGRSTFNAFPLGEIDIDKIAEAAASQGRDFLMIESCLKQTAFGKDTNIETIKNLKSVADVKSFDIVSETIKNLKFVTDVKSFDIVRFENGKGRANFSLNYRGTPLSPNSTDISGSLDFSLSKREPWEEKQDCMPDNYPYKVQITDLKMSD
ncbi:hypothetical protein LXA54_17035 [Erwinia amylovora]|uniref:hypothetical protein n=1 Tax=Erwinia amylovora TaxID=552 RepID=UPI0020C11474|nr:hypothetical protein [Erwinia amylovora]MCK8335995.1 hypothetical protein [Erwinia amylovora]